MLTIFRMRVLFATTALVMSSLWSPSSYAYFSVINTGELIAPSQYQISFEPQFVFQSYDGFNAIARFDMGLNEDSNVRGILGVGAVDFEIGGFFKWIPFPDTESQPAIGAEVGGTIARFKSDTEYNFRIHPLISKKFESEMGDVIPYGSIPLGISARPGKTVLPIQLVAGTEIRPLNTPKLSFFAEIGANVNEAFGYASAAITYRFNESDLRGN